MSDFTNIVEINGIFEAVELDEGVDFTETGDQGQIIVTGSGFGEGGFGEGPFGGGITVTLSSPTTNWTNVDTP